MNNEVMTHRITNILLLDNSLMVHHAVHLNLNPPSLLTSTEGLPLTATSDSAHWTEIFWFNSSLVS